MSYPKSEVRGGDQEELPLVQGQEGRLVQGKEQRLHFAGAAVKKYPTSKIRETQDVGVVRGHQRADKLKP